MKKIIIKRTFKNPGMRCPSIRLKQDMNATNPIAAIIIMTFSIVVFFLVVCDCGEMVFNPGSGENCGAGRWWMGRCGVVPGR